MPGDTVPVGTILRKVREILKGAGIEGAYTEALVLASHRLGMPKERLMAHPEEEIPQSEAGVLLEMAGRRARREPMAYIVGKREFMGIELEVGPGVLVPRPETETVVEWLVERIPKGARVVDVGTGSGAIALALKHHRPDLEVVGTDISGEALVWAERNAARLGLDVTLVRTDLLDGIEGPFRCVVANLPYVSEGDELSPETAYEPRVALYAPDRGTGLLKRAASQALSLLEPGGCLALEMAPWQSDEMRIFLENLGYSRTSILEDLAGRPRFLMGWRR